MKKSIICILIIGALAIFTLSPMAIAKDQDRMVDQILKSPSPTPYPGQSVSNTDNTQTEILMERIERGFRNVNGRLDKMETANKKRDGKITVLETDNKKNKSAIRKNTDDIKTLSKARWEGWKYYDNLSSQLQTAAIVLLIILVIGIIILFFRLSPRRDTCRP